MSKPRPRDSVSVTIDTPADGDEVPGGGSFMSFGYCNPTDATMTAWVTDQNNNQYNGSAVPPLPHDPPYQWGFEFSGVPTDSEVQLTAQGESGGDVGSDTITITCVT